MAVTDQEFEQAVSAYYAQVFRFALSLCREEAEAGDLTQESFYRLGSKGRQIQDAAKLKSWLMTTCYREFLRHRRHRQRFPHVEISEVEEALPSVTPDFISEIDAGTLLERLDEIDEIYRIPILLFYFQGHSYKEIAEVLEVPLGTVMSRLARGKDRLRQLLAPRSPSGAAAAASPARCSLIPERPHE